MSPRLLRLAACVAGLAVPLLAHAAPALAGTYSFDTDTTSELSGWRADGEPGYALCSRVSMPGPCNDSDVARPTPLRVFGLGSAAADANGHWYWVAPPTTSFVHGAVTLTYRTDDPDTSVYLKARKRPEVFASTGRARTATDAGTATWASPQGRRPSASSSRTAPARSTRASGRTP